MLSPAHPKPQNRMLVPSSPVRSELLALAPKPHTQNVADTASRTGTTLSHSKAAAVPLASITRRRGPLSLAALVPVIARTSGPGDGGPCLVKGQDVDVRRDVFALEDCLHLLADVLVISSAQR